MLKTEAERRLEDQLYWQRVGWVAHSLGLAPTLTDIAVLEHERRQRAKAQGLKTDSNWFEVFCKELDSGNCYPVPDYCECNEAEWYEDPPRAFHAAEMAHKIYKPKKR